MENNLNDSPLEMVENVTLRFKEDAENFIFESITNSLFGECDKTISKISKKCLGIALDHLNAKPAKYLKVVDGVIKGGTYPFCPSCKSLLNHNAYDGQRVAHCIYCGQKVLFGFNSYEYNKQ